MARVPSTLRLPQALREKVTAYSIERDMTFNEAIIFILRKELEPEHFKSKD